jgi:hypothetical protein
LAAESFVYMFALLDNQRANHEKANFDSECVRREHRCLGSSPRGLLGHSLDKRLLSGLGQFNSLEAIP